MSEIIKESNETSASAVNADNIVQDIHGMISNLLKNTVENMQKAETKKELGDTTQDINENNEITAEMGLADIKNFVGVMQKFIDNIKVMVAQIETGDPDAGETDDAFLDGYMATADNVLEIAAFSMKDTLTGLSNRYGFDSRIILEWNRATRDKSTLGLAIFGLDGFEKLKDNSIRENILRTVSQTLLGSNKRSTDFIARWSDNEFAALLPITDTEGAAIVVERIRTAIEGMNIAELPKINGKTAISMGVCVYTPKPGDQTIDFIDKAYKAYKKIKESGGDIVTFV